MSRKLADEIMVPAEHARAFHVKSGQTMRIIAVEGPQVGEVAIFNAHNYKEVYGPLPVLGMGLLLSDWKRRKDPTPLLPPAQDERDARSHRRRYSETLGLEWRAMQPALL